MSWAFIQALKKNPQQSYVQLLNSIRDELATKYTQKPQLSCSHPLGKSSICVDSGPSRSHPSNDQTRYQHSLRNVNGRGLTRLTHTSRYKSAFCNVSMRDRWATVRNRKASAKDPKQASKQAYTFWDGNTCIHGRFHVGLQFGRMKWDRLFSFLPSSQTYTRKSRWSLDDICFYLPYLLLPTR